MFRRLLNDWEVGRVAELLQVLDGCKDISEEKDSIRWKHARDGKFSVRRLYMKEVKELPGVMLGPWKMIWKNRTPTKIKCFTWLVARRACLRQENLEKRGFQIASCCSLCKEEVVTCFYIAKLQLSYGHSFLV